MIEAKKPKFFFILRALQISQKAKIPELKFCGAHFQAILTSKEPQKMIVFLSEIKDFCKSKENDQKNSFFCYHGQKNIQQNGSQSRSGTTSVLRLIP